jgi:D-alanyl-D-alanine carboxypeptidase (penicillin-binding protein 5/6)
MVHRMESNNPVTQVSEKPARRRIWRPAMGIAAAAAIATVGIAQPWHASTNQPALRPVAQFAAATTAAARSAGNAAGHTPGTTAVRSPGTTTPVTPVASPGRPVAPVVPVVPVQPNAVTVSLPTTLAAPGKAPHLPWPSRGQASIGLAGIGTFGASGGDTPVPIASVAKSMTAYQILKDHPLKANEQGPVIHVLPAEAAAYPHEVALNQSLVPVRSGEALTERQALNALMLASADNVAKILGRWDAGSVEKFLVKMNHTAAALGMKDTHYTDPSGYDAGTVSTVADQIRLADIAMKRADFAKVVSTRTAVIPVAGHIHNYNALLGEQGVVGIKTGSMSAAGGCLLFAAKTEVGGKPVTILGTVLGQRGPNMGILGAAFSSSRDLLRAVHASIKPVTVVKAGQVVGHAAGHALVATKAVTLPGWNGMKVKATVKATVPNGAAAGAVVGSMRLGQVSVPVAVQA